MELNSTMDKQSKDEIQQILTNIREIMEDYLVSPLTACDNCRDGKERCSLCSTEDCIHIGACLVCVGKEFLNSQVDYELNAIQDILDKITN